jgi:hypothetical protein
MPCARGCCDTQAEHFKSVQLGKVEKSEQSKMEKRWQKDHPAYKRLRANGLQPKHVDGSAEMEQRAETKLEIEMGRIFDGKQAQTAARIGSEISQEMGLGKHG